MQRSKKEFGKKRRKDTDSSNPKFQRERERERERELSGNAFNYTPTEAIGLQ